MVRIDEKSHSTLKKLARRTGKSQQAVIAAAIEELRRKQFLDELNASFEALKKSPRAWKAELAEREEWDCTLSDGLD